MESTAREALQRAIAAEHRLHQEMRRHEHLAGRWQQRAELALRRGENALATEALSRKADEERRAAEFRTEYLAHAAAVRRAERGLTRPAVAPTRPAAESQLDHLAREARLDRDLAALKKQFAGRERL